LQYFVVSKNRIGGTIPDSTDWEYCTNLQTLDLAGNLLHGNIPSSLTEALHDNLRYLNLAENFLSGTFPTGLFQLTKLHGLILSNNTFYGTIPVGDPIMDASSLSSHELVGYNWSQWSELGVLLLDENLFTGTIPVELLVGQKSSLGLYILGSMQRARVGSVTIYCWHILVHIA
jgi:hypothetical protein